MVAGYRRLAAGWQPAGGSRQAAGSHSSHDTCPAMYRLWMYRILLCFGEPMAWPGWLAAEPATTPAQFCSVWVGHAKGAKTIAFYRPSWHKRPFRVENLMVTLRLVRFLLSKTRSAVPGRGEAARHAGLPPHPGGLLNGNPRPQGFREPEEATNPKAHVR